MNKGNNCNPYSSETLIQINDDLTITTIIYIVPLGSKAIKQKDF